MPTLLEHEIANRLGRRWSTLMTTSFRYEIARVVLEALASFPDEVIDAALKKIREAPPAVPKRGRKT